MQPDLELNVNDMHSFLKWVASPFEPSASSARYSVYLVIFSLYSTDTRNYGILKISFGGHLYMYNTIGNRYEIQQWRANDVKRH